MRARREGIRIDTILHDDSSHFASMQWIASQSEVCLVFVSVFLVEAWDRSRLRLDHDGEEMIKMVEGSCAGQVVVVMHVGGQVLVEDWVSRVSAFVLTFRSICRKSVASSLQGIRGRRRATRLSMCCGATSIRPVV